LSPTLKDANAALLPPIADSRKVSLLVAEAVGKQAIADGVAGITDEKVLENSLHADVWEPAYLPYEPIQSSDPLTRDKSHVFHDQS
jgi:malate dehydrogenase (oxaloacetate-decarboxylating)